MRRFWACNLKNRAIAEAQILNPYPPESRLRRFPDFEMFGMRGEGIGAYWRSLGCISGLKCFFFKFYIDVATKERRLCGGCKTKD